MPYQTVDAASIRPFEILVVDDSPDDIRLIRDAFSLWKRNRDVQAVMTGVAAFQFLKERETKANSALPELILLDWNLPGIKGEEVLKRLKEDQRLREIPVVVFTSSSAPADRRKANQLGAERFITKPMDLDEFFNVIAGLEDLATNGGDSDGSSSPSSNRQ